jgi:hypothetical protein
LIARASTAARRSLFPGIAAVMDRVRLVVAQHVETVRMWRVTLTRAGIDAADGVTSPVSGAAVSARRAGLRARPARRLWLAGAPAPRGRMAREMERR